MKIVVSIVALIVLAIAGAIVFGGPKWPPPMASIGDPFQAVDFSAMPKPQTYRAADGSSLAYRRYYPAGEGGGRGSVVIVHGSSGSSASVHPLALAFAAAGYHAFALDIRGHGDSGPRGRIGYIGQLESDVESFVQAVQPPQPATLAGFSSGGGFVLRFAGGATQTLFHDYLLLAPFISQDAPNYRPGAGGWVDIGVPRVIALTVLNRLGVHQLNDLPVTRFAVQPQSKAVLTPEYSFLLAANFRPQRDFAANLQAVGQPCSIVAGSDDEVFDSHRLESIVHAVGRDWPVTLVPELGHIPLTLDPRGHRAAIVAVDGMRRATRTAAVR